MSAALNPRIGNGFLNIDITGNVPGNNDSRVSKRLGSRICTYALCVALMLAYLLFAAFVYVSMSNIANRSYLVWAERTGVVHSLPDLFLDLHASAPVADTWVTNLSNIVPTLAILGCVVSCVCMRDAVTLNMLCVAQSLNYLLNAISENVTVIPSSYGYARCIEYLGVRGSADLPVGVSTSRVYPNGSCAAMIWSGHVVGTILGVYFACRAHGLNRGVFRGGGPAWCTSLALAAALLESTLLLADASHYTVDCYLSMLLTPVAITHPAFASFASKINPLLGQLNA